ncbi:Oidioi.mRNA.OKI2018_I69.chr1.g363.t1.cds [Oikopleura dioica]|uniref:Oidioi.mRNA.OKI2018_I69.chr1.g363.t1.cds n=1 Tax=Oikopleura dioica TaxID=34765 RepID=A0ABN7SPT6_OIKDI|nr:Oidioi.mRNA.OKI2018_I69.chr1.g363.t1.cds [Oikopleura dioica]
MGDELDIVDPIKSCSVCMRKYDGKEVKRHTIKCGHIFCRACLDKTIKTRAESCPTCRKKFTSKDIIALY